MRRKKKLVELHLNELRQITKLVRCVISVKLYINPEKLI